MLVPEEVAVAWVKLKGILDKAKAEEMAARKAILAIMLPPAKAGTKHTEAGKVELTASVAYKLSVAKEDLLPLTPDLTDAEKACIEWKPSLKKKLYDALPNDAKLRSIVIKNLDTPSLKFSVEE